MLKLIGYILIAFISGMTITMLINKVVTLVELKDYGIKIFQGVVERFDRMMTGNDGCYSNSRFTELLWAIASLVLIYTCVLREIKIQEGILVLIGAAIGIGGIKGAVNKIQEVKENIASKGANNVPAN